VKPTRLLQYFTFVFKSSGFRKGIIEALSRSVGVEAIVVHPNADIFNSPLTLGREAELVLQEPDPRGLETSSTLIQFYYRDYLKLYFSSISLVAEVNQFPTTVEITAEESLLLVYLNESALDSLTCDDNCEPILNQSLIAPQQASTVTIATQLEVWLTLVCCSVSMTSLVISLILYLVFPSLLNVPSKMFFNLALALLGAHSVFLLSGAEKLLADWRD
jgi:hypothetical protein